MSARIAFPYRIEPAGRTATVDVPAYVEALVRLVLQTDPGERVNRPDFGGGLKALVFIGMDGAFAAAAETLIRGVLLHWLGDTITIGTLQVSVQDSEALVGLTYTVAGSGRPVAQVVRQGLPGTPAPGSPLSVGRPGARLAP